MFKFPLAIQYFNLYHYLRISFFFRCKTSTMSKKILNKATAKGWKRCLKKKMRQSANCTKLFWNQLDEIKMKTTCIWCISKIWKLKLKNPILFPLVAWTIASAPLMTTARRSQADRSNADPESNWSHFFFYRLSPYGLNLCGETILGSLKGIMNVSLTISRFSVGLWRKFSILLELSSLYSKLHHCRADFFPVSLQLF